MEIKNNCTNYVDVTRNTTTNKLIIKAKKKCIVEIVVKYKAYSDKKNLTLNNITNG